MVVNFHHMNLTWRKRTRLSCSLGSGCFISGSVRWEITWTWQDKPHKFTADVLYNLLNKGHDFMYITDYKRSIDYSMLYKWRHYWKWCQESYPCKL